MSLLLLFHPRQQAVIVVGRFDRGTPAPGSDPGGPAAGLFGRGAAGAGVDTGAPDAGVYDLGTPGQTL